MKTKLYGASDDLIEIDGAISDEVGSYNKAKSFEASDGTKGKISYNGEWKIDVKEKGDKFFELIEAVREDSEHSHPEAKGCSSYSDVLVLREIDWLMIGKKIFKADV